MSKMSEKAALKEEAEKAEAVEEASELVAKLKAKSEKLKAVMSKVESIMKKAGAGDIEGVEADTREAAEDAGLRTNECEAAVSTFVESADRSRLTPQEGVYALALLAATINQHLQKFGHLPKPHADSIIMGAVLHGNMIARKVDNFTMPKIDSKMVLN